jgi:hypothetical protein
MMPEKCFYDNNIKCPKAGMDCFISPCPNCPFYPENNENNPLKPVPSLWNSDVTKEIK